MCTVFFCPSLHTRAMAWTQDRRFCYRKNNIYTAPSGGRQWLWVYFQDQSVDSFDAWMIHLLCVYTYVNMSVFLFYLNVIGRVPVNIIQHQVRSADQIKSHPTSFGAQQKQEVLRIGAVKTINQSLSLAGRCVSVESAEGVAHVYAHVLEQVKSLSVVGHHDHPAATPLHCQNCRCTVLIEKTHSCTCKYTHTCLKGWAVWWRSEGLTEPGVFQSQQDYIHLKSRILERDPPGPRIKNSPLIHGLFSP